MAQIGPIEVVVTTTSDVGKALEIRDALAARIFALGAAIGLLFGWLGTWMVFRG